MIKLAKTPGDVNVAQLIPLLLELDKIHHEAAPERFPLYSSEKRTADLQKIFDHGCIFYAEKENQIIGFASLIDKGEKLIIEYLFVRPEFRLQKIGTQLVENILAQFPNKELFASVYAFNFPAIKFYEKIFKLSSLVYKK